jgi:signal transduction histidine kinase
MIQTDQIASVDPDYGSNADWRMVLARDGTVLAATGGARPQWAGRSLADCDDAPGEVKDIAHTILTSSNQSPLPVTFTIDLSYVQKSLHLTVVEAVPVRRTPTDIRGLLRSSLDALRRQARDRDVTLEIVVEDRVPASVRVDAVKIAWATSALVGNALRYVRPGSLMMPGGSIRVVAAYDANGPHLTIEVHDNGPGIPADRLPFLFAWKSDRPHAAPGLSMVRDLVAAHGGSIEFLSDADAFLGGTTIRLTLPVS